MSKSKPELKLVEDTGSQLQEEDLSTELPPQQTEMPFAVVEGEPITQLPRDLYIPPDALQVFLTAFEGPLDLLLYLIRKQNLDILNIPISEITRQYMEYIEVMAELQLELAGEYLLMAAMLAEIKSRMLLPRPQVVEGQEEEDPRAELVRRLQEYERFKKAAEDLDKLKRLERDTMPASAALEERKVVVRPPDVTLKEMLDAFREVLARAEKFAHHHISREPLSQRERMSEILAKLQTAAFFEFTQLFKPEEGRMGVTVTFIAILELMKEGLIEIVQAEPYGPIHVRPAQRHLKVVQGGAAASEVADAENVAALAQPELEGENDIPDEDEFDETPPPDEAAVAVEAAVADVAAASSIAVESIEASLEADGTAVESAESDSAEFGRIETEEGEPAGAESDAIEARGTEPADIETERTAPDTELVDAAISEALASTEAAVESVAAAETEAATESLAATDELAAAEAEAAAGSLRATDELAVTGAEPAPDSEPVAEAAEPFASTDEPSVEDVESAPTASEPGEEVAEPFAALEEPVVAEAQPEAAASEPVAEVAQQPVAALDESAVAEIDSAPAEETQAIEVGETIESHAEEQVVEEHVIEEHTVEEHVVHEHVVEEHVVPEPVVDALSVDDDTVTGSSSEADNSDAEPSR